MNQETLESKLLKDLEKSGFASEIRAVNAFIDQDWSVVASPSYEDLDENRWREYDIQANLFLREKDEKGVRLANTNFHVAIDVKKSKNPWIVFRNRDVNYPHSGSTGWRNLIHFVSSESSNDEMTEQLNSGLGMANGWVGYGIHESFKNPNQPSQWYKGVLTVCKASENIINRYKNANIKYKGKPTPSLNFVQPVIVLDGKLFNACLNSSGEIDLEESNMLSIEFEYQSAHYKQRHYFVDIVTIDSLNSYIEFSKTRFEKLNQSLVPKER